MINPHESPADTLAGPCLTPRVSAHGNVDNACLHTLERPKKQSRIHLVFAPVSRLPLPSREDVSRTAKLFPLPPCRSMTQRSRLLRSSSMVIFYHHQGNASRLEFSHSTHRKTAGNPCGIPCHHIKSVNIYQSFSRCKIYKAFGNYQALSVRPCSKA